MVASSHRPVYARPPTKFEANIPTFFIEFLRLAGKFWNSERKEEIRRRAFGLVGLTVLQIAIAVSVTEWSSGLFNALEQRSASRLWTQVWLVVLIFAANMGVTFLHLNAKRRLMLDWRSWLTDRLVGEWMAEGRHYQVTHLPGRHDNPDGRIAEDIRIATEYAIDLAHSLLYSLLLLVSFAKILWSLSGTLRIPLGLFELPIPGYLVWLAIAYAAAASAMGWKIGLPLTSATHARQAEEANFRFALVRARENSEGIALVRGETDERRRLAALFGHIALAWDRQTLAFANILLFTSGYSVLSMAFPVLAASPRYVSGAITLGALVQSTQAFQQMVAAMSFPVDNLTKMAEWRASVERVLGLVRALEHLDEDIAETDTTPIVVAASGRPSLAFQDLSIANPDNGLLVLEKLNAEIRPGERVFLAGDPAVGGKLFKAVAGLWPWGDGRIELPGEVRPFFMPPTPYLPIESLLEAVSYPSAPDTFGEEAALQALRRVGLEELAGRLRESAAWEHSLSHEQMQRLGVARLLLHRPSWIFLEQALDSLSTEEAKRMMALICEELPGAAILSVTRRHAIQEFHHRHISIECPSCEVELESPARKRRERDRRGKTPVSPMNQIWGTLRKDRRKKP